MIERHGYCTQHYLTKLFLADGASQVRNYLVLRLVPDLRWTIPGSFRFLHLRRGHGIVHRVKPTMVHIFSKPAFG